MRGLDAWRSVDRPDVYLVPNQKALDVAERIICHGKNCLMQYWKVIWRHDFEKGRVVLFSEIGGDGYETRKVQECRDGRLLCTDGTDETAEIGLSEIPVGSIEDVAAQPAFSVFIISVADFEAAWDRAARHGN